MEGKELTLQEKIDRAKPGDIIWHVVEDPNPLVLQKKPTVTRKWVIEWREKLLLRGLDRDIGELSIEQICEDLGIEVIDD